jgi:hypothetical protein
MRANHRVDDVGQVLDRIRELAARDLLFGTRPVHGA